MVGIISVISGPISLAPRHHILLSDHNVLGVAGEKQKNVGVSDNGLFAEDDEK